MLYISIRWLLAETFEIPQEDRQKYYEAGSTPFDFDLVTVMSICNNNVDATCIRKIVKNGVNLTEGMWPNFVVRTLAYVLITSIGSCNGYPGKLTLHI